MLTYNFKDSSNSNNHKNHLITNKVSFFSPNLDSDFIKLI